MVLVVVKNGLWPLVPLELELTVRVTAEPLLVTALPKLSWTWTTNGPTVAVELTVRLPLTVEVKAYWLAGPATMVNPLVVVPVTLWELTVPAKTEMVGELARVSE